MDEQVNVVSVIERVTDEICNHYCKYNETIDEEGECIIYRAGGKCHLAMLI